MNPPKLSEKELNRLEFAKTSIHVTKVPQIHETAFIDSTAIIGHTGFGYARDNDGTLVRVNHSGNVVIGEEVEIRAYVTVDRGTVSDTIIERGCKIDHKVHCSHNCKIGEYTTIAANSSIEGSCVIGSHCTIGSNVTVQRKVKVGNWVLIGSGSVVTKDIPDYAIVVGSPARILRFREH